MVSVTAPERTRRRAETSGSSMRPTGAIGLAARGSEARLAGVGPKKMQIARPGGEPGADGQVADGRNVGGVGGQVHVDADAGVDLVAPGAHRHAQRKGLPDGVGGRRVVQARLGGVVARPDPNAPRGNAQPP